MTGPIAIDLRGRRALITGASSGLGLHFATVLARQGADLVIAARRMDRLEGARERLLAYGTDIRCVGMDVTSLASVEEGFARIGLPVHIVVNNSGLGQNSWLSTMDEPEWDRIVQTNLGGVWRVTRSAIAAMTEAGIAGSIINVASITALRTAPKSGAYAATKAAVDHLTRSTAVEVARHGIRVNSLAPGYFPTELNEAFLASEAGERMRRRIPLGRFGRLEDLDLPLLMLASDLSRYVTGATLCVDGGHAVNPL